jgi:hypothetical protein
MQTDERRIANEMPLSMGQLALNTMVVETWNLYPILWNLINNVLDSKLITSITNYTVELA